MESFGDEVSRIGGDEFIEIEQPEKAGSLPRRGRGSRDRECRYPHPQRVDRRRTAAVGAGIESQVHPMMQAKILFHRAPRMKRQSCRLDAFSAE